MNLIPALVSCIKVDRRRKLPRVHSAFGLSICETIFEPEMVVVGQKTGPDPLGEQKGGPADTSVAEHLFRSSPPVYQCIAVSQNVFEVTREYSDRQRTKK